MRVSALLVSLAALLGACASEPAPPLDRARLAADWHAWVASRDSLFRSEASPLPDTAGFEGLTYFPYDSSLALPAQFVPTLDETPVSFPTTTGDLRPMVSAGHLVFEIDGVQRRLEAFRPVVPGGGAPPSLFVPFRDATSGRATYGGGRYLDLDDEPSGRYALDLNRAYHPYCVYDAAFSCPLPPAENTLSLAVTAGERLPHGDV